MARVLIPTSLQQFAGGSEQGDGLMGAGPGHFGTDGEVLAGVLLAALDAFFEIEVFLL